MSPSAENIPMEAPPAPAADQPAEEEKKPRRPREEYPQFDDPKAELATAEAKKNSMTKPDRDHLERKVQGIQTSIEADKKKADRITKDLEHIKEENAKKKASGTGELEVVRVNLREIKAKIMGHIEEKKKLNAMVEAARNQKKAADEKLKAAKSSAGSFRSNDEIELEVERIETYMMHNTLTVKEEKEFIAQIKALRASKESVANLEKAMAEHSKSVATAVGASQIPEIMEMRKEKDALIDALKEQEASEVAKLEALKVKREKEQAQNRFSELFEERNKVREGISENITAIRAIRDEFKKEEDDWFKTDRLIRELKRQVYEKTKVEREEKKKAWEEAKLKKAADWEDQKAAWEAENEAESMVELEDGTKVKPLDWDLADRIALCEQLQVFLEQYKPKEGKIAAEKSVSDGRKVEAVDEGFAINTGMRGLGDDPLGLNAFMVDEAVSAKKSKKDKKKAKAKAKASIIATESTGPISLRMSLETMEQFGRLSLPVPVDSSDVDSSLSQLLEKKDYYEKKGKEGLTLKEVLKSEKEARKAAKQAVVDAAKADADALKEKDEAEAAAAKAAEEEALAKIKAAEEAAFQKKIAEEEAAREKARKEKEEAEERLAAEAEAKALAEKAKEAKRVEEAAVTEEAAPHTPRTSLQLNEDGTVKVGITLQAEEPAAEAEPEIDVAALRAKAQGKSMTDEEKKARGLLYDTSKAKAVRDDESSEDEDDEAADFCGGDPFAEL